MSVRVNAMQGASSLGDDEMLEHDEDEDEEMMYGEEDDDDEDDDDEDQEADLPAAEQMSVGSMEVHDMHLGGDGPAPAKSSPAPPDAVARCSPPSHWQMGSVSGLGGGRGTHRWRPLCQYLLLTGCWRFTVARKFCAQMGPDKSCS